MDNTKHNLYTESLSAKISRLEQTIQELKNIIEVSHKINRRQETEINELNNYINTDMTDIFVVYDRANDTCYKSDSGDIVFYKDENEAVKNCYGNEEVIKINELIN